MSASNKPTIEGFVERLLKENHIKSNETVTVENTLNKATDGMTPEERAAVIRSLNEKLDAPSSDLITPQGLNFASFESEVKTVTQVIIKNKDYKENQEKKAAELAEKNLVVENKNQEKESEREMTKKNIDSIRNLLLQFPEFSDFEFSEIELEELGKTKTNLDKFIKRADEMKQEHPELLDEEIIENAAQECGIDLNSGEIKVAIATRFSEDLKKIENVDQDNGIDLDRLIQFSSNTVNFLFKRECELAKREGKKLTVRGLVKRTFTIGAEKIFNDKNQSKNSEIEALEKDGWYLNLQDLKNNIEEKEEIERCFTYWRKKNIDKYDIELDYTKLAEKYLCTDKSISQIYEQLKKEDPKLEVKFNDVLNGIIENLKSRNNAPDAINTLESIRKSEEERRVYEQFMKSLKVAESNAKEVGGANKENNDKILKELEKNNNSNIESIKKVKEFWIQREKIDFNSYKEENREAFEESEQSNEQKIEKFEKDRDRIIRDRNQVIKISKELGISTDEAAKKYFEENPKRLKQYSIRERRILLGKNDKDIEKLEMSLVLRKLGSFVKFINKRIISIAEVDIKSANQSIARVQGDISQPYELEKALSDLEKAEQRIAICEKINARLDRGHKKKDASEVLNDKLKKENEKEIFSKYLMSGKNATELLKELNKDGNEYNIRDVIKIITEGARKHLKIEELKALIDNEKSIYNKTIELEAIQNSKKNAEEKGLTDWVKDYEKQIEKINDKINTCQNTNQHFKKRMQRRMGILGPNEILVQRKKAIEENKIQDATSEEKEQKQETQMNSQTKSSIEFGSIETGGKKHNIKAIAQKGKVTQKGIKEMFAKIKSLYNNPKKSKQDVTQEEKITSSEEIR